MMDLEVLFNLASKSIQTGDSNELRRLLDTYPSLITCRDSRGRTLLHIAASAPGDEADIVNILLIRGTNPEALDEDEWTAADWADFIVNPDVLLLLKGPGSLAR